MTARAYQCEVHTQTEELPATIFQPEDMCDGYQIVRFIGAGGFGEVYEVRDAEGESWALKAMRTIAKSRKEVRRAMSEAEILRLINHPHVCRYHDSGITSNNIIWTATELLHGVPLRDAMAEGPMPVERALRIARQICHGAEAVHARNVVHRDLKPENVFLMDGVGVVKILDFNAAKYNNRVTIVTTRPIGSPLYMCRGQLEYTGQSPADPRWDIYAVGLMTMEMIIGYHPFLGEGNARQATQAAVIDMQFNQRLPPLAELLDKFPTEVSDPIAKAVERDPERQFQTMGEFADALNRARRWWKERSDPSYVSVGETPRSNTPVEAIDAATQELNPAALATMAARDSAPSIKAQHGPKTEPLPESAPRPVSLPKTATATRPHVAASGGMTGDVIALVLGVIVGAIAGWFYLNASDSSANLWATPDRLHASSASTSKGGS